MVGLAAAVTTLFVVVPVLLTLLTAATGNLSIDLFAEPGDPADDLATGMEAGTTSRVANLGTCSGQRPPSSRTASSCTWWPRRCSGAGPASAQSGGPPAGGCWRWSD